MLQSRTRDEVSGQSPPGGPAPVTRPSLGRLLPADVLDIARLHNLTLAG